MSRKNLSNPEWRKKVISRFPLGRFAQPEEIAGAAVYLGSSESDWVTGQTIVIDGEPIVSIDGIMGQQIFFEDLPEVVCTSLLYCNIDADETEAFDCSHP